MDITREHIDELNAVVKVAITKDDYSDKVEEVLNSYRKNANISGFSKCHVPMGLVKKQYGKAVLVDEINKLFQVYIKKYLTEYNLNTFSNTFPIAHDNIYCISDVLYFVYEVYLSTY